jgi:PKD repeat protein
MRLLLYTILGLFMLPGKPMCQINFTANDSVATPPTVFRAGYNSGFAAGWSDLSIATMATGDPSQFVSGTGLTTNRDALFFEALSTQGYTSKLPEVMHYLSLGQGDLTALTLGGADGFRPEPPAPFRDTAHYCPTKQSTLFANMYTPIWDGGANGTPYNDTNYYAAYMYKTVDIYKDYIQFWEIWNEPGFDFTGNRGWRLPGDPVGNWWDNDPNPCDYKLYAPVQHYVRMLRIAWDIIKTLDPTAHVCMGAPGFESFVDAVARNTDNPVDGSVTPEYPLKGGAYFDAMCYHSFPHIDGSFIIDRNTGQVLRNSDIGAEAVSGLRNRFEDILEGYGYNDTTYPRKQFLITEINLPRKIFNYTNATYGGQVQQRNFMMKAFMECKKTGIMAMNVYTFGELGKEATATDEFELMGLYLNMDNTNYFTATLTESGIGIKTMAKLINNTQHDPVRSAALQTNSDVRIEAFKKPDGKYIYALWAKMKQDYSEIGTAKYTFPASLNISPYLKKYLWTNSITAQTFITAKSEISLDGTPMFLEEEPNMGQPLPSFSVNSSRFCVPMSIQFTDQSANADSVKWEFSNAVPAVSTALNPVVTYATPGFHTVRLTAYGANGTTNVNEQNYYIHARTAPTAVFYPSIVGGNVFFLNGSFDADSVHWDFGDNSTSSDVFPAHTYALNGNYLVTMTTFNPCGTTVFQDTVRVLYALEVEFDADPAIGCAPLTVQYQANSPLATSFKWTFPGGVANYDTVPNPIVTYANPGFYPVSITVANNLTAATITRNNAVQVGLGPDALVLTYTANQLNVSFVGLAAGANTYLWNFGDGTTSTQASPIHQYAMGGTYQVTCSATNDCGTETGTVTVTIGGNPPNTSITASQMQGCAPLTVQYSDGGVGAESFAWTFAGGTPASSTLGNQSVTYTAPGVYTTNLITTNQWGSDTATKTITVIGKPDAEFGVLLIDSFMLECSPMPTNAVSYLWIFGDGGFSTAVNPTHTYTQTGVFDLLLITINACGRDTAFALITIGGPIPNGAFIANATSGCAPLTVMFQDQSTPAALGRQWTFAGGTPATSTAAQPTVTYTQGGMYPVQLIVENGWGRDTNLQLNYVQVGVAPTANFTHVINNNSVTFTNASVNENAVLWNFGDNTTSSLSDPVHVFTPGTYTVTLSASNACGAALYEQTITITSGNDDLPTLEGRVKLYPNPANEALYFDINTVANQDPKSVEIYDMQGKLVQTSGLQCAQNTCGPISIAVLPVGNYYCKLRTETEIWVAKFEKK